MVIRLINDVIELSVVFAMLTNTEGGFDGTEGLHFTIKLQWRRLSR